MSALSLSDRDRLSGRGGLPFATLLVLTVASALTGAVVALVVQRLLASRREPTARSIGLGVAAAVALAFVLVGIDAATGGSSHVTDAVGSGPGSLAGDTLHRWRVSWAGATSSGGPILMSLSGLAGLAAFALLRPRSASVEALVAGVVVSLLVNDTPQDVLALGALTCASLWAWERFRPAQQPAYAVEPTPQRG
jgi:hypothetical protein